MSDHSQQTFALAPGAPAAPVRENDIVFTPDDVARAVVERFRPSGRVLDPCKGGGAFLPPRSARRIQTGW